MKKPHLTTLQARISRITSTKQLRRMIEEAKKNRDHELEFELVHQLEWLKEQDRNYAYYKTGKGRNLIPIEAILRRDHDSNVPDDDKFESSKYESDCGVGASRIYDAVDNAESDAEEDRKLLILAASALIAAAYPHLLYTFLLILKNDTNRKESIWELRKATTKNSTQLVKNIVEILRTC